MSLGNSNYTYFTLREAGPDVFKAGTRITYFIEICLRVSLESYFFLNCVSRGGSICQRH